MYYGRQKIYYIRLWMMSLEYVIILKAILLQNEKNNCQSFSEIRVLVKDASKPNNFIISSRSEHYLI